MRRVVRTAWIASFVAVVLLLLDHFLFPRMEGLTIYANGQCRPYYTDPATKLEIVIPDWEISVHRLVVLAAVFAPPYIWVSAWLGRRKTNPDSL